MVAADIADSNPALMCRVFADPSLLMSLNLDSAKSEQRITELVSLNIMSSEEADNLRDMAGYSVANMQLSSTSDALLELARRNAAHAIAEEVRSGVPGLWSHFTAVAEALRPHAHSAGGDGHE